MQIGMSMLSAEQQQQRRVHVNHIQTTLQRRQSRSQNHTEMPHLVFLQVFSKIKEFDWQSGTATKSAMLQLRILNPVLVRGLMATVK